jgi:hypothetical protein
MFIPHHLNVEGDSDMKTAAKSLKNLETANNFGTTVTQKIEFLIKLRSDYIQSENIIINLINYIRANHLNPDFKY